MPVTVTLVRHGQTTKNLEKKIQTRTDALLSETGIKQAEALGRKLAKEKYSRVYCSTLTRTKQTAEHILKFNTNVVPALQQDKRVRERDFGDWEDLNVAIIHGEADKLGVRMHQLSPPNGESYHEFAQTGLEFFMEICNLALSPEENEVDENILIVSHGGWILTLLDNLCANTDIFRVQNLAVDNSIRSPLNTSYSKFEISANRTGDSTCFHIHFHTVFDAEHLKDLP